MRGLRKRLAMIVPLFIILFCVEFSVITNRIVKNYEKNMSQDYNIIVVSKERLSEEELRPKIVGFASLSLLDTTSVASRLKSELTSTNYNALLKSLPFFYSVKLNFFPSPQVMNQISTELLKNKNISRVETFTKTHDKVYRILQVLIYLFDAFVILVGLIVFMVIFSQIRIWIYEQQNRLEVMRFFGASYLYRAGGLYVCAIFDSFVSTIFVLVVYLFGLQSMAVTDVITSLGFTAEKLFRLKDFVPLFFLAIGTCFFAVIVTTAKVRK